MDQFDKASELEQVAREKALSHQRSKISDEPSFSHCVDCGEDIPEARRQAIKGVKTCIDCQEFNEMRGRSYG